MNDGLEQAWRAVEHSVERAVLALRFPTDDPGATALVALVIVVAGLLVAVAFMAFASPGRSPARPEEPADAVDALEPGPAGLDDEEPPAAPAGT